MIRVDYVYWWVDGVHFRIRLESDRLCCLVIIGVRPDGTKQLVAVADGYRESTESWADLLRDRRRAACGPRSWPPATAPWASGPPCATSCPRRASRPAGCTRRPASSTPCPSGCMSRPRPP